MKLFGALKWSFFSELAAKLVQPLIFIICARLLVPEDFGVASAALMVVGFAQIFWDAGLGAALIQSQADTQKAANAAFWMNLALGIVIAIALAASSAWIANTFFHDARVTPVLQLMSLQIVLGAISAVHVALLQKDFHFERLFWVRLVTASLPGIASVPLAWAGFNYWALVAGSIVGQLGQTIVLWRLSSWRPKAEFSPKIASELARFGSWVSISGLLGWFYTWADSLIVGMYLGSHDLGLYRTGNQLAMLVFYTLFGSVRPVLYSTLSRIGADKERIANIVPRILNFLALASIPLAFTIFMLSDSIGQVVFGTRWKGVGLVIGVMALAQGYSWLTTMNADIYRAIKKPQYDTIVSTANLAVYTAVYLVTIHSGFVTFLWARLGLTLFALIPHLVTLRFLTKSSMTQVGRKIVTVTSWSALTTATSWFLFRDLLREHPLLMIVIGGGVTAALVAGIIWSTERNGAIKDVRRLLLAPVPQTPKA